MYIPFDKKLGIHPQDDAFLFMDPVDMKEIEKDRPLLHRWPWERLIRSQVLKQPDVVLMEYLLNDQFDTKIKLADYKFYEPKTIHDSSLSPCIHAIMAAELGLEKKAFDYYNMTARLDLDDYNGNANAGIHIACHAGSWMAIINGFAGMRVRKGKLCFDPHLPKTWKRVKFALHFQGRLIAAELSRKGLALALTQGEPLDVLVDGKKVRVS
jgi:trehalose/maltose hydrolase-like predicted phosphorylase